MEKHPGGLSMTGHLLELSGMLQWKKPEAPAPDRPIRILDMGAGDGHTIGLLKSIGFDAQGIDLAPPSGNVLPSSKNDPLPGKTMPGDILRGNFLCCPFPDQTFDAVISECAFYLSGDVGSAVKEAARVLKDDGLLLLADVSFLDIKAHTQILRSAGFSVRELEDCTKAWKEYYISCIWDGTDQLLCPAVPKGKCYYFQTICKKMNQKGCDGYGFI